MNESSQISGQHHARFEVLPLGRGEEDAAKLPQPVRLTVTCSPRHGPDRSVAVARRLTAHGHAVTVHLAARMVRDRVHLDKLLAEMAQAEVNDVLLIGGDATPPHGTYASAVDLLPVICDHSQRPREIGIAGIRRAIHSSIPMASPTRWSRRARSQATSPHNSASKQRRCSLGSGRHVAVGAPETRQLATGRPSPDALPCVRRLLRHE